MTDIKQYEELMVLLAKDWEEYLFPISHNDKIHDQRENSKFIRLWDVTISSYEVKKIYKKAVDSMESFILTYPDNIREKLRAIIKDRKDKNFKTNWPEHLEQIAKDKKII